MLLCFGVCCNLKAQSCPPAWEKYKTSEYMFDIQSDINSLDVPEADFTNSLLNSARLNLAKQVRVAINDRSTHEVKVNNGRTQTKYSQLTESSVSVDMSLVETHVSYDAITKRGFAIAFINTPHARRHYVNQLEFIIKSMRASLSIAQNHINNNFKDKAETELQSGIKWIEKTWKPLFWLNVFGLSENELKSWNNRIGTVEVQLKQQLSNLEKSREVEKLAKFNSFLEKIHHMLDVSYICSKHHMVGVNYIVTYQFNDYLMVGAGTGLNIACKDYYGGVGQEWPLNRINIPLYAYAKSNFVEIYDFSLFFDLAFGGRFSTPSRFGYNTCGLLLNPRFGFNYQVSESSSCYFAVGYQGQTLPCLKKFSNYSIVWRDKFRSAIDFHIGFTF